LSLLFLKCSLKGFRASLIAPSLIAPSLIAPSLIVLIQMDLQPNLRIQKNRLAGK
jgi:hypothetical protein